ncbi:hypothetical protein ZIOFF_058583 [Zingiber officinale]|uniref:WRKY domain-containing protein n=1 Tax=Zingiber officinale TaxID=94328 RepID=A0A8J5FGH1_ZINOF|nr:hypothetical protein ZIOFF_058583 [Zingiber officinale]
MVEDGAGRGGAGEGSAPAQVGTKPPRPSITLPARYSLENLFRSGAGSGSGAGPSEASPGPLTLVSSFFAEDPESESHSFTQLLVGAMNSPADGTTKEEDRGDLDGGGVVRLGQEPPESLSVGQHQVLSIPPGLRPASLFDSPAFFSSRQASNSQSKMLQQTEYLPTSMTTSSAQEQGQEFVTLKSHNIAIQSAEGSHSDQWSRPNSITVDKPVEDGYNWRKYGQKMVRGSEYPRSYYKCSHLNCPVKKKIEHSVDGQVTEIVYKGQHNHQRPAPNKRSGSGGSFSTGSNQITDSLNNPATPELSFHDHQANIRISNKISAVMSAPKRDRESDYETPDQLSVYGEDEEASEVNGNVRDNNNSDAKRLNVSDSIQKPTSESRIIVQTTSEVDLLDDGYRWRKYGQKVVKGNPHPRSYYKCTFTGCNVRKHIERAAIDPKAVITTYEGKHNHDLPASRNSSHSMAGTGITITALICKSKMNMKPNKPIPIHSKFRIEARSE